MEFGEHMDDPGNVQPGRGRAENVYGGWTMASDDVTSVPGPARLRTTAGVYLHAYKRSRVCRLEASGDGRGLKRSACQETVAQTQSWFVHQRSVAELARKRWKLAEVIKQRRAGGGTT